MSGNVSSSHKFTQNWEEKIKSWNLKNDSSTDNTCHAVNVELEDGGSELAQKQKKENLEQIADELGVLLVGPRDDKLIISPILGGNKDGPFPQELGATHDEDSLDDNNCDRLQPNSRARSCNSALEGENDALNDECSRELASLRRQRQLYEEATLQLHREVGNYL